MCKVCDCDDPAEAVAVNLSTRKRITLGRAGDHAGGAPRGHAHEHVHSDGTRHIHSHDDHHHHHEHGHDHAHDYVYGPGHASGANSTFIDLEARVLAKNDALADRDRAWSADRRILAINLMGAPGAGKTALLERTIRDVGAGAPLFVVEGDQERIRAACGAMVQSIPALAAILRPAWWRAVWPNSTLARGPWWSSKTLNKLDLQRAAAFPPLQPETGIGRSADDGHSIDTMPLSFDNAPYFVALVDSSCNAMVTQRGFCDQIDLRT